MDIDGGMTPWHGVGGNMPISQEASEKIGLTHELV